MSDEPLDDAAEDGEESFAELLESYSQGMNDNIQVGEKLSVKIISVGEDTVFVDTGTKVDGTVEKAELLDDDQNCPYAEGDELELYVVSVTESEIRLSRAVSGIGGLNQLKDAYDGHIPVQGKVLETCKGGFRVEMLHRKAFCPVSQMDIAYVETPEDYVGQTLEFLITRFEERGKNIVVSRRKILEKEREKTQKEFYKTVAVGDVIPGKAVRIMPYGVFVELAPGVEGMVHISELSWSRVSSPEEAVSVGDPLNVKILKMESDKSGGRKKISLSCKQASDDPWNTVEKKIVPGSRLQGKVTRCMDFGAFVEVAPGIEGLVHISEMSYVKRVLRAEDVVKPGQTVSVMVKDLDLSRRRISLSMKDAEGDPWAEVTDKFPVGSRVEGLVEKRQPYGLFIQLQPGVTGLLPQSKISRAAEPAAFDKLREGDTVSVAVESIDTAERKISLGPSDVAGEDNWKDFSKEEERPMGDLARKLQEAMNKKN